MNAIDGIEFHELPSERYWSFPKNSKQDPKTETQNMIFSNEYLGALKIDGSSFRFIKDMNGEMRLQGRDRGVSGTFLNKIGHVPQLMSFFQSLPNGTCLLGEIYFPNKEGSSNVTTIMGCLEAKARERQEKGDKLYYYIFDIWAFEGKSYLKTTAEKRFHTLEALSQVYSSEYVEWAKYFSGKQLWGELQLFLANGREGMVITRRNGLPEPGKRTARKTLKIKKELQETIDVAIIGANPPTRLYSGKEIVTWKLWESIRTGEKLSGELYKDYQDGLPIEPVTKAYFNGWAGSLIIGVKKDNRLVSVGSLSGLTEEVLQNWEAYKGKVAEITAMEIFRNEDGSFSGLRHPKFIQWRLDKTVRDCEWSQLE